VGNLHLRFDEGRAGRAMRRLLSYSTPPCPGKRTPREDRAPSHRPQMSSGRLFLDRVARTPRKPRLKATFLLCQEHDISTLP